MPPRPIQVNRSQPVRVLITSATSLFLCHTMQGSLTLVMVNPLARGMDCTRTGVTGGHLAILLPRGSH